ncbi:AraC family transcriptional regulator [Dyadobacter sp. CY107]|uniref:AraC family transcriptional regulator n=1 Tax=Dyadobacter fanqingshengii TaxID=2906443 RepID=UPI001F42FF87|nr:AraC family transcriptional regulator [Dyadobacter fanqingshengii]MCF2505251.1 AraC family transcriptional regulator [Dyadobacter fanqingshengii]
MARSYTTPFFETPWHQHEEYELLIEAVGSGSAFVGDHIGEYSAGDVFLLGKNLPHWFRKKEPDMTCSAIVVQFREDIFGENFLMLPEMQLIRNTLRQAAQGIVLKGELREIVGNTLRKIESLSGFTQLAALLDCLHQISISDQISYLTQSTIVNFSKQDQDRIHKVFEYTMQNFQKKILLEDVASLTHQSVSAFSHYFKKSTKKNYIQFLTEIRISHACKLLVTTEKSITEICYESGFHNWSNFSQHFNKIVQQSPMKYRKEYTQVAGKKKLSEG